MGIGGCFENLDLIEGVFANEFLSPLLSSQNRKSLALRFLTSMKFGERYANHRGVLLRVRNGVEACHSSQVTDLPLVGQPI